MIDVKDLTKYFGQRAAVDRITFQVEPGQIVGFLGPNGAGKTTTIRILTGYMPATSGAANVAGFDVFSQSLAARRQIGYLPESVPLYTDMRVREYLNFRAKLRGMSKPDRQKRLERVVEMCWLGEAVDRPIGQLSKGFRQRVGLADALIHDPKVLILDEPTIGLDPTQIREMRNLIRQLGGKHTVLLSSHILPEVEATCDRTIIIAAGRIVAQGTVEQLRHQILGGSRVIAELRGNGQQMRKDIAGLGGVRNVELQEQDGWNRLLIETSGKDVREDVSQMAARKGWNLREIRLEVGSLEEFFVQVVARQHEQQQRQANAAA
jgi:ABC-2 type transport system ATP-binding protein